MTGGLDKRFPFDAYPTGWFQVAYSREVDTGQIIGLHYFGRRLICYRGDSGTAYVLDAYCLHLGADIALGGAVTDECVTCSFHGWRFDGTGHNVEIPYAKTVNRTARLRAWPTVERAGVIFVWYSPDDREPEWELPKIPEADDAAFAFYAPESARWRFRSHPQEVCENTVDIAHFATVHGVSGFGALDLETDGEYVDARYMFFVQLDPDSNEMSRMGLGFARDFCKQIEQDIPIWESKIYRDRPQLARGEGAINDFRTWARTSYQEATT